MPVSRIPFVLALLGLIAAAVLASPGWAADAAPRGCLSKAEQRAAVASGKAVPLAQAIKALNAHGRKAEVVRAELCPRNGGLVYVLTVLARDGKVTRVQVDAASGAPIKGH
ncbi:MAG: PepSY domain-containing protein [Pseudolabrys sp.]|nr:PepSY domain-containing protein [Pseudolabrys sp.]